MSLFDQFWDFGNGQLVTAGRTRTGTAIACREGLIRVQSVGGQPSALERVFDAMGFAPDDDASTASTQAFRDRLNRRLKDTITIGFPYPPNTVRWELVRLVVDQWWAGPPNDPANIDYPEGR